MPPQSLVYRPDIDGLRAIAVMGVVLCHAGLGVPGGFLGVDVFFVISGFLIFRRIQVDISLGIFSFVDFWERRLRRILPALVVMLAVVLAVGWFSLLPGDCGDLARSAFAAMTGIANFHFWGRFGYFQSAAESQPLLHTWSLSLEEQCYLVISLSFYGLFLRGWLSHARRLFWTMAFLSLGWSLFSAHLFPRASFYLLPARIWELLAGGILSLRVDLSKSTETVRREVPALIGIVMIGLSYFVLGEDAKVTGLSAIPVVVGTVLLIGSGCSVRKPIVISLLSARPLVFLGLISYSIYLWHWPAFAFARIGTIRQLPEAARAALIVLIVGLSALTWRYIERPIRQRRWLGLRRRFFITAATAFTVLVASSLMMNHFRDIRRRLPRSARVVAETQLIDPLYLVNLEAEDVPVRFHRLGVPRGRQQDRPELLVWGDSHAIAILPAVDAACRELGISALAASRGTGAPAVDYAFRSNRPDSPITEPVNIAFQRAVLRFALREKPLTVLLVACWGAYVKDGHFGVALLETVTALRESGIAVYFMKNAPAFNLNFAFEV